MARIFLNTFLLFTLCLVYCEAALKRIFDDMQGEVQGASLRNIRRRMNCEEEHQRSSLGKGEDVRSPLPLQILILFQLIDYELQNLPRVQLEQTNLGLDYGMNYFGKFFSTYAFDEVTGELSYEVDLDALTEYAVNRKGHQYSNEGFHLNKLFLKAYGISAEAFYILYKEDPFREHFEKLKQKWLSQAFGIILSEGAKHDLLFELFSQRNPTITYSVEFVMKFCKRLSLISADLLDEHFTHKIDTKRVSPKMMECLIELKAPDAIVMGLLVLDGSPGLCQRLLGVALRTGSSIELVGFIADHLKAVEFLADE